MKASESELMPFVGALEKSSPVINRIPTKARDAASVEDGRQQIKGSGGASKQPIKKSGDGSDPREPLWSNIKVGKLEDSLPRFGPLYPVDQPSVDATKKKAWEHILKKSSAPEEEGVVKEIYLKAVREVETEAKDMYGHDNIESLRVGSSFRWMMIRDGCFFLQIALLILGCSEQLGYPPNDPIFGKRPKKKDIKKWIEAMFYVGNQIPLSVLGELMNQKFFQDVIKKKKWDPAPSGLCNKGLYEILVLPALKRGQGQDQGHHSDLLHALQNLVMGPAPQGHPCKKDDQIDLEANEEEIGDYQRIFPSTNDDDDDDDQDTISPGENINNRVRSFLKAIGLPNAGDDRPRIFPCATELKRAGIRIKKLKTGGFRRIRFKSYYFWSFLYLPAFPVDDNTELILGNLIAYEKLQKKSRGELGSYVRFMADLLQSTRDARLLMKKGIIEGNLDYVEKFPQVVSRVCSQDIRLTQELCILRRQIMEYSSPWIHYKGVINVVVLLTLIQTLFALVAYFKPPRQ